MSGTNECYQPLLAADVLIVEVRRLLGAQRACERLLGRYLADLADRIAEARRSCLGVFEPLRVYPDIYAAAQQLFSLGRRRTRELVRMGRLLRNLPLTERAFVEGEIGYSRVREITRVARPEDEARWVAMARDLPMRALERRVAEVAGVGKATVETRRASEAGRRDAASTVPEEVAHEQGLPAPDVERCRTVRSDGRREPEAVRETWVSPDAMDVRLQLRPETWAMLQRAMDGARQASEAGGWLSDDEALHAVARDALAAVDRAAVAAQVGRVGAGVRRTVVLYECRRCKRVELETGAGAVELGAGAAAAMGCGAAVVDPGSGARADGRGGPLPAPLERVVRLRDRDRCRVPGCVKRRYVDVHPVDGGEQGGRHSTQDCACLCVTHHRDVHAGELVIRGEADGNLRFLDSTGRQVGDEASAAVTQLESSICADEARVLEVIGTRGRWHRDALTEATGLGRVALGTALMGLELSGKLLVELGGLYSPAPVPRDQVSFRGAGDRRRSGGRSARGGGLSVDI